MSKGTSVAIKKPRDIALPRYDDMCKAIAACHKVDEAKSYRDKAEALRAYAKQANNRDAEVQFAEIKVRAERKCGELLHDMAEKGERAKKGRPDKSSSVLDLSTLGIDPTASSRFQQIAKVPERQVEAAFKEARENQVPVTSAQIRQLTKTPKASKEQLEAHDRLWRVLRALEEIAKQDVSPSAWLDALPDFMQARTIEHLKKARPWLERLFSLWDKRHGA